MEIVIKLTERAEDFYLKSISAINELYRGDIKPVIDILKDGFVEPAKFDDDAVEEFNKYLKSRTLMNSPAEKVMAKFNGSLNGTKNIDFNDMFIICDTLELMERIWIGQWDRICKIIEDKFFFTDDEMSVVNTLRDKITNAYSRKGLERYASYGIYSPELKDEIRLLYAFQKVYRYEVSGRGNDMGEFRLNGELNKDLPEIILPYKEKITFKDYDEIAHYVEKFAEYQNENYSSAFDRRKIHVECGEFFFPTAEYTSYLVEPGDTVCLRQNDYFIVRKNKDRS